VWVRKPFPTISGYESLGDDIRAKRWLDFKLNQLLDTGDPIWEIKGQLKSIKDICEFVITEFDYPLVRGVPIDVHKNNWFSGLCCHQITEDFWQYASETASTYRLNKRKGKKGVGDCEDTSVLFTTLMLERGYNAYECFGVVKENGEILGGHGWSIFQDENYIWRIFESTLDVPPPYPDGYPEIDLSTNTWVVGNIVYEAWLRFNRKVYYEWEEGQESVKDAVAMISYTKIGRKFRESKKKYKAIEEAWKVKTKPLRKAGILAKIRWR